MNEKLKRHTIKSRKSSNSNIKGKYSRRHILLCTTSNLYNFECLSSSNPNKELFCAPTVHIYRHNDSLKDVFEKPTLPAPLRTYFQSLTINKINNTEYTTKTLYLCPWCSAKDINSDPKA